MTIHKSILRSGFVKDVGRGILSSTSILARLCRRGLYIALNILKFIVFDITPQLNRLPFGNWICLAYIVFLWALLSDACYCGELWRVLIRLCRLMCYDRIGWMELLTRTQSYIRRWLKHLLLAGWEIVKPPLKKYTVTFVKEIVLENVDDLSQLATTTAGSTMIALLINSLSSQLIREITPILSESIRTMDFSADKDALNTLMANVGVIKHSTFHTEFRLEQMDQRMTDLHLQLEYIRVNQPDQFKDIVLRILPFVTAKDLLTISAGVPRQIIRYLTNGGPYTNIHSHSLKNGNLF